MSVESCEFKESNGVLFIASVEECEGEATVSFFVPTEEEDPERKPKDIKAERKGDAGKADGGKKSEDESESKEDSYESESKEDSDESGSKEDLEDYISCDDMMKVLVQGYLNVVRLDVLGQ
eukprot:656147_1